MSTYWSGKDGDAYTDRQTLSQTARASLYRRVLAQIDIESLIEFGANDGSNLTAIRALSPTLSLGGVEINPAVFETLRAAADAAYLGSMLDPIKVGTWDLSFTRGVLIHIWPDDLPKAYEALYNASNRYICLTEYYSPHPRMIPYRGQDNLLWARDFAGEMMARYPLKLVDYFFTYRRDPLYPQDDVTTFLMEKL